MRAGSIRIHPADAAGLITALAADPAARVARIGDVLPAVALGPGEAMRLPVTRQGRDFGIHGR